MKSIATVNTFIPTIENSIDYRSDQSLRDFDIIVFDPELPYFRKINFDGGGSCIDIEGSRELEECLSHWADELKGALLHGKTVFVLLNSLEKASLASGSTVPRKGVRNYSTYSVSNYKLLPVRLNGRNSKGRRFSTVDPLFKSLAAATQKICEYRVVFDGPIGKPIFSAADAIVGAVCRTEKASGHLVLLPYWNFSELLETVEGGEEFWSDEAITIGRRVASQLAHIDKTLRSESAETPRPEWLAGERRPAAVEELDAKIRSLDDEAQRIALQGEKMISERMKLDRFSALLYENGEALEQAVNDALSLFGYESAGLNDGDVQIDHVIVGTSGVRMIAETEGRDASAIDVSKFRQLESNIAEDFERNDIESHAKGLLFGNAFRLVPPAERAPSFTAKCIASAKRIGAGLVRTPDLYQAIVYVLDNPEDTKFKEACRAALENTCGDLVRFPSHN